MGVVCLYLWRILVVSVYDDCLKTIAVFVLLFVVTMTLLEAMTQFQSAFFFVSSDGRIRYNLSAIVGYFWSTCASGVDCYSSSDDNSTDCLVRKTIIRYMS